SCVPPWTASWTCPTDGRRLWLVPGLRNPHHSATSWIIRPLRPRSCVSMWWNIWRERRRSWPTIWLRTTATPLPCYSPPRTRITSVRVTTCSCSVSGPCTQDGALVELPSEGGTACFGQHRGTGPCRCLAEGANQFGGDDVTVVMQHRRCGAHQHHALRRQGEFVPLLLRAL